jgi:hypothetical protein
LGVTAVFAPASDEDGGHPLCADRLPRPWSSRRRCGEHRTWSGLGHANPALTRIVTDCAPALPSARCDLAVTRFVLPRLRTSMASAYCVMIER